MDEKAKVPKVIGETSPAKAGLALTNAKEGKKKGKTREERMEEKRIEAQRANPTP